MNTIDTLKTMVTGMYQIQDTKIRLGNQLSAYFRQRAGIEPGEKAEQDCSMDAVKKTFKAIVGEENDISARRKYLYEGLISNYAELVQIMVYIHLEKDEQVMSRSLLGVLREIPIYTEFLEHVRGVGPAMAGVIISEIDISRAKYASSLWKYAGLDVAEDGKGRSRKKEHLTKYEYVSKDGETKTREGITFNPFLKTKLVGVLGSSFIKQPAEECIYRKIYDDYKHRLESSPIHQEKTKGHRHNMAVRYAVKQFLVDLYTNWRQIEGLTVFAPYSETKLGIRHAA